MLIDAYLAFARIDAVRGFLEVRHGNGAAKHLYEKNGYHLLACRKNYYKHPDEDADIYEIAFTENGEQNVRVMFAWNGRYAAASVQSVDLTDGAVQRKQYPD